MKTTFFNSLSSVLWRAAVTAIVLLAIYVSFGRFLMTHVERYESDILALLNTQLPFTLEADAVRGEWQSFSPVIVLQGLRLITADSSERPIELNEGRISLDVWESLTSLTLQISNLQLDQLLLKAELSAEGKLSIAGLGGDGQIDQWLEHFLLNVERIALTNNRLLLNLADAPSRSFKLDLTLRRAGSYRHLEANLLSHTTGTVIYAAAKGLGNPFKPSTFTGDLYLDMEMTDLSAVQELIPVDSTARIAGELDLQVWLTFASGASSLEVALEGKDLSVAAVDESWLFPLDTLSLAANVQEDDGHWTAFATDLVLARDEFRLEIPRLQLDSQDDSLQLRASNVDLQPLGELLEASDSTPAALVEVFDTLDIRGRVSNLQLDIADRTAPAQEWRLAARFEQLAVNSWRGAPAVVGASGYVELDQLGGFVDLDSQQLSLLFPTVYRQPLYFDELYGRVGLGWDDDAVKLSSGLLTAQAPEGQLQALFSLNIPLQRNNVGLEMDLLVGMENLDPQYLDKYLPYILNDSLLQWLDDSIGGGLVEQGAFLWRGSLLPKATELRTVQLFLNVADVELSYHPEWPPLSELQGTVLIDDTSVSVWSDSARLYGSQLEQVSVETWLNSAAEIELAVVGQLRGPAADGLKIVNTSPLDRVVAGALREWQLDGDMRAELRLQLNLAHWDTAPQIQVNTVLQGVDLSIVPGNLRVEGIRGRFNYSSEQGFSSSNLIGSLWGEPLQATVGQRALKAQLASFEGGAQPDSKASMVQIELDTRVAASSIARWLELDMLALAEGKAHIQVEIQIPPGEPPMVIVESELIGLSLDLPQPWRKPAEQAQGLRLELPLGGDTNVLKLTLADQLNLHLLLDDGRLRAGGLAFQRPVAALEPGQFRLSGHSPLVDVEQWQQFVDNYIVSSWAATGGLGEGLSLAVDELQVDTLVLMGQDINELVLSLEEDQQQRILTVEASWLRGQALLAKDFSRAEFDLDYLELSGLSGFELGQEGAAGPLQLPATKVTISALHSGGKLLGELAFSLATQGELLSVGEIEGDILGLQLGSETAASLHWLQAQDSNQTTLKARILFQDFGQTLERLGYQKILETTDGHFDLELQWPGGPQAYALGRAAGGLQIHVDDGRFLEAPAATSGTLKVVSILNLADIVGRLSVLTMFDSGIPFHSVDGEVFFHSGSIEVASMDVQGTSSSFQYSGVADIEDKTLEGELVVTLPVASNLPWVVALTAGLPVAAGVYVFSKVFGKQMNRVTSAVYSVSGAWDDPQFAFSRFFDNTSRVTNGVRTEREIPAQGDREVESAVGVEAADRSSVEASAVGAAPADRSAEGGSATDTEAVDQSSAEPDSFSGSELESEVELESEPEPEA